MARARAVEHRERASASQILFGLFGMLAPLAVLLLDAALPLVAGAFGMLLAFVPLLLSPIPQARSFGTE